MPHGALETAVNLLQARKLSRRGGLVATKLIVFVTPDKADFITANLPPVLLLFFNGGGGGLSLIHI